MANPKKHLRGAISSSRCRMKEAYLTPEVQQLREKAFSNLKALGYFDEESKQVQGFGVSIRNSLFGFENPLAPEFITFRVTVVHDPVCRFVITRNTQIKGKAFDPKKARFRFIACSDSDITFAAEGYCIHLSEFKIVLEQLAILSKPPIKRPVK